MKQVKHKKLNGPEKTKQRKAHAKECAESSTIMPVCLKNGKGPNHRHQNQ